MPKGNSSRLAAKANKLYWGTSRPAGHLADELGISRSKFYGLIEPLPLDARCEACSAPLTFASRSDRDAGRGRCPECGTVVDVPAETATARPVKARPPQTDTLSGTAVWSRITLPGTRELWLTAIVGVAAGLLATAWWRRR